MALRARCRRALGVALCCGLIGSGAGVARADTALPSIAPERVAASMEIRSGQQRASLVARNVAGAGATVTVNAISVDAASAHTAFAYTASADAAPPPRRIAALAPHLVEMAFALGAGDRVVATVAWADYPAAAADVPRVGDAFALSLEVLADLRPDLILAWSGALGGGRLAALERLGVPIWISDPEDLDAVRREYGELAALLGADPAPVRRFEHRLAALDGGVGPVLDVLPLVSVAPPLTVADDHFLGDLLRRCGARNPEGAGAAGPVLELSRERLLVTDARLVLLTVEDADVALESLRLAPGTELLRIDPDLLVRPGPRVIDGAEQLCAKVRAARAVGAGR